MSYTEFKLTNASGSAIVLSTLDNFSLAGNAVDVDVFDNANGGFGVEDVINNSELEAYLQSGDITAIDQYGGLLRTVVPLYGHMYTEIAPPLITTQVDDYYPLGWENAKLVCLDLQGIKNCTGFKKTFHGDIKLIRNDSAYEFKIKSNNSASQAENRVYASEFRTNAGDFRLKKYSIVQIIYHGGDQKWYTIDSEKP